MNLIRVRFRFDVPGIGSVRFQGCADEELFGRIRSEFAMLGKPPYVPKCMEGDVKIGRRIGYIVHPAENDGFTRALSECFMRFIAADDPPVFARRFRAVTDGDIHKFLEVFLGASVSDLTDAASPVPDVERLLSN